MPWILPWCGPEYSERAMTAGPFAASDRAERVAVSDVAVEREALQRRTVYLHTQR